MFNAVDSGNIEVVDILLTHRAKTNAVNIVRSILLHVLLLFPTHKLLCRYSSSLRLYIHCINLLLNVVKQLTIEY